MLAFGLATTLTAAFPVAAADLGLRGVAPPPPLAVAPPRFYIHAGPAGLFYAEKATMTAAGFPIVGGNVSIDPALTFAVEAGYFVTPNIAVAVAVGYPPITKFVAAGTITGLGGMGKAQGGPAGLNVSYHFTNFGAFQPYVGVGLSGLYIFGTKDGVLQNLKVDHALGFNLQAGFNYMFNDTWGVFVDVKKNFIKTIGTGTLGGAPIKAKVTLDPVVLHTGITYKF